MNGVDHQCVYICLVVVYLVSLTGVFYKVFQLVDHILEMVLMLLCRR